MKSHQKLKLRWFERHPEFKDGSSSGSIHAKHYDAALKDNCSRTNRKIVRMKILNYLRKYGSEYDKKKVNDIIRHHLQVRGDVIKMAFVESQIHRALWFHVRSDPKKARVRLVHVKLPGGEKFLGTIGEPT